MGLFPISCDQSPAPQSRIRCDLREPVEEGNERGPMVCRRYGSRNLSPFAVTAQRSPIFLRRGFPDMIRSLYASAIRPPLHFLEFCVLVFAGAIAELDKCEIEHRTAFRTANAISGGRSKLHPLAFFAISGIAQHITRYVGAAFPREQEQNGGKYTPTSVNQRILGPLLVSLSRSKRRREV